MMKLRIDDNTGYSLGDFEGIKQLVNYVSNQTLAQLEKDGIFVFPTGLEDAEDITAEQMILKSANKKFYTSNLMGVVGYKNEILTIGSRFSTEDQDYFLNYMLEKVFGNPSLLSLNVGKNDNEQIFNWLVFIFPTYLVNALRKGLYKTYEKREYNDSNIKGIIDIQRHIKENIPFTGKIAYNQREFTYDNDLMELIRHTIEFIKSRYKDLDILRPIKDEVQQVIETTQKYELFDRARIINVNKKMIVKNLFYHEYRDLQRLCLLILQNNKHQLGEGIFDIHGIIFDGAWLWEEYINTLIGEYFFHPKNKSKSGTQYLFRHKDHLGSKFGKIYPDFIGTSKDNRFIADAKYKPTENIYGRDYLQLVAYMYRFSSKQGFYIYPENTGKNSKTFYLNHGLDGYDNGVKLSTDIIIFKLGLLIPSGCKSYEDFKMEISGEEEKFKHQIFKDFSSIKN